MIIFYESNQEGGQAVKQPYKALISFISFVLSIVVIFVIAGLRSTETITTGQAIITALFVTVILAIDIKVLNSNFVDGEWRC